MTDKAETVDQRVDTQVSENHAGPKGSSDSASVHTWQRISPLSVIHYIVCGVTQFIKQGVQNLLPLIPIVLVAGENRWLILSAVAVLGSTMMLAGAFLRYMKFRYRLSEGQVHIQSGVLKRKRLHLGYDRIQNVVFEEPIYFRPFKLVSLKIESAGSSGEEVSLAGLPRPLAEEIRHEVLNQAHHAINPTQASRDQEAGTSTAPVTEEVLLKLPVPELVRYGLSNNNIWVTAGLIAGVLPQIKVWETAVAETIIGFGRDNFGHLAFGMPLYVFLLISSVFLLLLTASVIGGIITQYNYTLTRGSDGRFHRIKGLFDRQETSMLERKIQSVVFKQSWIARLLNRWHIVLRQVSFSGQNNQPTKQGSGSLLIPSATDAFLSDFRALVYPGFQVPKTFHQISKRFILRTVAFYFLPPALLVSGIIFWHKGLPYALIPLIFPVVMTGFMALRWKRYGYARDENYGYLRKGLFGQRLTLFPFFKVQGVKIRRSYGQRRSGHATLQIKMAGNSMTIPYMPYADALVWRDWILYKVESSQKSFM